MGPLAHNLINSEENFSNMGGLNLGGSSISYLLFTIYTFEFIFLFISLIFNFEFLFCFLLTAYCLQYILLIINLQESYLKHSAGYLEHLQAGKV